MLRVLTTVALLGFLTGSVHSAPTTYNLSGENTKITFVGTKPEGKHEGGFKIVKGTATVDGSDLTTLKIAVDIDMNSLFSDDPRLTGHLKSPDFFGVKNNPKSKFVTTKVAKTASGVSITGNLTLNGKTKEVTFPAKVTLSNTGLTLTSDFSIDRTNWGMTYGKGKVDDKVGLSVKISAKK